MNYCTRCVYPENHPLKITFNAEGVCSGCIIHEEKDNLDWKIRLEKLKKIIEPYKKSNRSINNCIIPVSGARDSYFIVDIVKNVLGLNPLLVNYNKQYNTEIGIRNLSYLRTIMGCPIITKTVNPIVVKKITQTSLNLLGSMYWHCLAGYTVFPVQMACKFKIPLIIWGAHQGIDQVGMYSHTDEVEMTRKYRKEHDLMGFEAEDLLSRSDNLTWKDIEDYIYPHDKEINTVGVRGIYLNNYLRWDTKKQHEDMIKKYNYETENQIRTFDSYNDVDCFHYSGIHDKIKFFKWGFSKIYDHVSREIRLKRINRTEGIELIKKYESCEKNDEEIFFNWLGTNNKDFYNLINKFRDKSIWEKDKNKWKLKDNIYNHRKTENKSEKKLLNFKMNSKRTAKKQENQYTLIGRGWVDE